MTKHTYNLLDMTAAEIEALMKAWDEPTYRAHQIYQQIYVNLVSDPGAMTNLSLALRERIKNECRIGDLELARVQTGDAGNTRKALFTTPNGQPVETVLMIYRDRATVCVSTQSGCAIVCSFCATGRMGFKLNLTAGEMIQQILWAAGEMKQLNQAEQRKLTNVVYMGMGEPFNNYSNWWKSVDRLHDPNGFNLGARNFTVSTIGVIPGIQKLAREKLPINLAISLHAPNDELRQQLVPVNKQYPIAELIEAVRKYTEKTGRRVSFEYVLMNGVNDSAEQAHQLARLLRGEADRKRPLLCHVNLIPWNPVSGMPLNTSAKRKVLDFQKILEQKKIACTVRAQRGVDIAAACGQLAGQANALDSIPRVTESSGLSTQ